MNVTAPKHCLTAICTPDLEEKLLDCLLDQVGNEIFTSTPTFSHGTAHGRLSATESVLGRSRSVQVQILLDDTELDQMLLLLGQQFAGTGLRYWVMPLSQAGEVQ